MAISMATVSKTWQLDMQLPAAEPSFCIAAIWTPLLHRVMRHSRLLLMGTFLRHFIRRLMHLTCLYRRITSQREILLESVTSISQWPPAAEIFCMSIRVMVLAALVDQ